MDGAETVVKTAEEHPVATAVLAAIPVVRGILKGSGVIMTIKDSIKSMVAMPPAPGGLTSAIPQWRHGYRCFGSGSRCRRDWSAHRRITN